MRLASTIGRAFARSSRARGFAPTSFTRQSATLTRVPGVISKTLGARAQSTAVTQDMFCYQCEQTRDGEGCTTVGVCGKEPTTAAIQDALVYALKGLSMWGEKARELGVSEEELAEANEVTMAAMFSTLTNVNFDDDALAPMVKKAVEVRDEVRKLVEAKGGSLEVEGESPATWVPSNPNDNQSIVSEAKELMGVPARKAKFGDDVAGLQELIIYGAKGASAYGHHATRVGAGSIMAGEAVAPELHEALAAVGRGETDVNKLVAAALKVGGTNLKVLKSLDAGHTDRFGAPEPSPVNHSPTEGKCILVSGHDLHDLEHLLKQTEGTGVNVYTHGEMLPAFGYPELRKYSHLKGHWGGPWQLQKFDFFKFPGPIIMTSNCLVEPAKKYKDRLFTSGVVGWPGCKHIDTDGTPDYSEAIKMAQDMKGFPKTEEPKTTLTGFGHKAVVGVADKVIAAAQAGDLKRIVLIGGCDGTESERSYYTDLGVNLPQESLILTLGCNKFRLLSKKDFGCLPNTEIPRLLDMGQCNDSYSAVAVAVALADALETDVNGLPLSIVLSWFEQKAVAVLLSLLHLGVKDIRVGPNLPAFVTPNVLKVLQDNFNLMPVHPSGYDIQKAVDEVMQQ